MPVAQVPFLQLFSNLGHISRTIAIKTQKPSLADQSIIKPEMERLLSEDRIEKICFL